MNEVHMSSAVRHSQMFSLVNEPKIESSASIAEMDSMAASPILESCVEKYDQNFN